MSKKLKDDEFLKVLDGKEFICSVLFGKGDIVYNEFYHPYPEGWLLENNTDVLNANLMDGSDEYDPFETYKIVSLYKEKKE